MGKSRKNKRLNPAEEQRRRRQSEGKGLKHEQDVTNAYKTGMMDARQKVVRPMFLRGLRLGFIYGVVAACLLAGTGATVWRYTSAKSADTSGWWPL